MIFFPFCFWLRQNFIRFLDKTDFFYKYRLRICKYVELILQLKPYYIINFCLNTVKFFADKFPLLRFCEKAQINSLN